MLVYGILYYPIPRRQQLAGANLQELTPGRRLTANKYHGSCRSDPVKNAFRSCNGHGCVYPWPSLSECIYFVNTLPSNLTTQRERWGRTWENRNLNTGAEGWGGTHEVYFSNILTSISSKVFIPSLISLIKDLHLVRVKSSRTTTRISLSLLLCGAMVYAGTIQPRSRS